MKPITFIPNTKSDDHCSQACLAMIATAEGKPTTMKEIDRLSGLRPGQWMWKPEEMRVMEILGFQGTLIEAFDYGRLAQEGPEYFSHIWTPEGVREELDHTDIHRVVQCTENMAWIERPATMGDIRAYVEGGWYVVPNVNSRRLAGLNGRSIHTVLIREITSRHVYLADPGLPPHKNREIPIKRFEEAFQGVLRAFRKGYQGTPEGGAEPPPQSPKGKLKL